MLANMTEFGKTPVIPLSRFGAMGYHCTIFPVSALRVAMGAATRFLAQLRADGHAGAALEELVGEEMSAASPQTRIEWMTENATKINFAKFKSSVEKVAADKRHNLASTPIGAERPMLLSQLVSSVKKAAPIPATVTPTAQPRALASALANKENGSVNGFTPSPAAARLKRSKMGNESDAENAIPGSGKMEMTVGDDRRLTRRMSKREALQGLQEMRTGD